MHATGSPLHVIEWAQPDGLLSASEPDAREVAAFAPALAAFYNDPHNAAMMAHSTEMTPADVIDHFASLRAGGGRPLLLFVDGVLMGDADLRHVEPGRAELAFMVGARAAQGRGLGTRFGLMIEAFAFRALGLDRIYASIIPANKASLRSFEKMGFRVDPSAEARRYADEDDDVTVSIEKGDWEARHGEVTAAIALKPRPG